MQSEGTSDFIPDFRKNFGAIDKLCDDVTDRMITAADETQLISLNINISQQ